MSEGSDAPRGSDPILDEVRRFYESHQEGLEASRHRHRYYYDYLTRILQVRVPQGQRVLDLGCGSGHLLAALHPSRGVGIDISGPAIRTARERHGDDSLSFVQGDASDPAVLARAGGPFDVILLVNVVTHLTDVQAALEALQTVSHGQTRVLIYSYSRLWQPLLHQLYSFFDLILNKTNARH